MPHWNHTLNIKDLLDPDEEDGLALPQRAKAMADRIHIFRSKYPKDSDEWYTLDEILEGFIEISEDTSGDNRVADFDYVLADLYDFGDEYRVWMGP